MAIDQYLKLGELYRGDGLSVKAIAVYKKIAKLDPNEASYALTRDDGQTLLFLMLCSRSVQVDAEVDREAVRNQLIGQQLNGYAASLIAELRAAATIVGE